MLEAKGPPDVTVEAFSRAIWRDHACARVGAHLRQAVVRPSLDSGSCSLLSVKERIHIIQNIEQQRVVAILEDYHLRRHSDELSHDSRCHQVIRLPLSNLYPGHHSIYNCDDSMGS